MILYSPMRKDKYTMIYKNLKVGLGVYKCQMEVWNLASISSRYPFNWELMDVKKDDLPCKFPHISEVEASLLQEINGTSVLQMVRTLDPMEFFTAIKDADVDHIALAKYWYSGRHWKAVVRSRALAWYKSKGNKLTKEQEYFMKMGIPGFENRPQGRRNCRR